MAAPDPFDELFHLEDRFYAEGFRAGEADGMRAGRSEGRTLGLEKGFHKFVESGRLHGKAVVWANRLHNGQLGGGGGRGAVGDAVGDARLLPPLPRHARLQKNVRAVYALVEPGTLSTANTDEAVSDFDDRVKRAQGKARIVERMAGELAEAAAAAAAAAKPTRTPTPTPTIQPPPASP